MQCRKPSDVRLIHSGITGRGQGRANLENHSKPASPGLSYWVVTKTNLETGPWGRIGTVPVSSRMWCVACRSVERVARGLFALTVVQYGVVAHSSGSLVPKVHVIVLFHHREMFLITKLHAVRRNRSHIGEPAACTCGKTSIRAHLKVQFKERAGIRRARIPPPFPIHGRGNKTRPHRCRPISSKPRGLSSASSLQPLPAETRSGGDVQARSINRSSRPRRPGVVTQISRQPRTRLG